MIYHLLTKFHPNGTSHGKVMTSYRFFFNFSNLRLWSWKSTCGFGFSDNTRLAMSKSISTPNFDKIAQSTAELLLHLIWERTSAILELSRTSGFDLTYWSSRVLTFCIGVPNLNFLASTVPEIYKGSKISKVSHVTPSRPSLTWFCIVFR